MSETLDIPVRFGTAKSTVGTDGAMRVSVPTDGERAGASLAARLHRPGVVRDALLAMGDVLSSDLRRKATDRADYLQYLIQRGKGIGKAVWDAQKEYLALQYSAAAKQDEPLDPILTVDANALRIEVMSRDESTYAQLVLRRPAALVDANGYLLFESEHEYKSSPHLAIGKQISVRKPGISAVPGYVPARPRGAP